MRCLLIRVGADQSDGGGGWNAPVDSNTREFVYAAIPESKKVHPGTERPYSALAPALSKFGVKLPDRLRSRQMHLDPDFDCLTYGDQGERAKQLEARIRPGDQIVFYSSMRDVRDGAQLIYAIIGIFAVADIVQARKIPASARDSNAHSRRMLPESAQDIVVRGQPKRSGRLERCLPIGEWRNRAYRVRPEILEAWGGLSVKDGFLQRSARLPEFIEPPRFLSWFESKRPGLLRRNN